MELVNPFYDTDREDVSPIDRGIKDRYDVDPFVIVNGDIDLICGSDGIVAVIDKNHKYGTIMEIVYACYMGKPVYLVVTNGDEKHPWLVYHATKICTGFEELEQFIKGGCRDGIT